MNRMRRRQLMTNARVLSLQKARVYVLEAFCRFAYRSQHLDRRSFLPRNSPVRVRLPTPRWIIKRTRKEADNENRYRSSPHALWRGRDCSGEESASAAEPR